ncbi:MAG: hypothetical protein NVS4B10_11490 [Myxococcales bacterium]
MPDEVLLRVLLEARGELQLFSLEDDFHGFNMVPVAAGRNRPLFLAAAPEGRGRAASVDPVRSPC